MGRAVRVNATLDADLLERVDAFAERRYEDRSTAIRQLVDFALREMAKREALEAYRQSRVTLREFARALGLGYWEANELLRSEGVAVAQGDRDETRGPVSVRGRRRGSGRSASARGTAAGRPRRPRWRGVRHRSQRRPHRPREAAGPGRAWPGSA